MKIEVIHIKSKPYDIYVDMLGTCPHDNITVETTDLGYDSDGRYQAYESAICADCGDIAIYEQLGKEFEDIC